MPRLALFSRSRIFYVGTGLLLVVAAWLCGRDPSGRGGLFFLSALQLAPLVRCGIRRRVDFLALILAGQFIGYCSAEALKVLASGFSATLASSAIAANQTLIVCTLLTGLGFYGLRRQFAPPGETPTGGTPATRGSLLAAAGALLFSYAWLGREEASFFLLHAQFVLCAFVFCVDISGHRRDGQAVRAVAASGALYSYLLQTNLGFAINLLAIWITQATVERRGKIWGQVGVLLLVMLPLQWVKADYRYVVGQHPSYDVWQRGRALLELLGEKVADRPRTALTLPAPARSLTQEAPERVVSSAQAAHDAYLGAEALKSATDRVHDDTLERVIAWTPEKVDFWRGRSYANFFHLILPRAIWKADPDWNIWNQFGRTYGIISPVDSVTEVVFSSLVEAYMNFGYGWLYLFSFLLGMGLAVLQRGSTLGSGPDSRKYGTFGFICFLIPFLSYQEDLGSSLAKLLWSALLIYPFLAYQRLNLGPRR